MGAERQEASRPLMANQSGGRLVMAGDLRRGSRKIRKVTEFI